MKKFKIVAWLMVLVTLCTLCSGTLVFATTTSSTEPFHLLVVQPSVMTNTHEIWDSTVTVKGPNGEDTVKLSKDNMTDSDRWVLWELGRGQINFLRESR